MEKNTKILLGVGAAISLYLILKPKKAAGQSNSTPSPTDPKINTTDYIICPQGYVMYDKVVGGVVGIIEICKDAEGSETEPMENPNYIDTKSQYICPKGSYNRGRLTPNVSDETCSDGSIAIKNPNLKYGK
jgi:hypothetical protein